MSRNLGSAAVLLVLVLNPAISASCPTDSLRVDDGNLMLPDNGIVAVSDTAYTLTYVSNPELGLRSKSQEASYSIPQGRVFASAAMHTSGWCHACEMADPAVVSRDTYTLLGPAGSDPIDFTFRLHVDVASTGLAAFTCQDHSCVVRSGTARAALSEVGGQSTAWNWASDGIGAGDLDIALHHGVGDTFELRVSATANADFDGNIQYDISSDRSARIEGRLSVLGLPEGYAIVSCQGYQSGTQVPVRTHTWGRLKSMAR